MFLGGFSVMKGSRKSLIDCHSERSEESLLRLFGDPASLLFLRSPEIVR